jgi:hypothetical protein
LVVDLWNHLGITQEPASATLGQRGPRRLSVIIIWKTHRVTNAVAHYSGVSHSCSHLSEFLAPPSLEKVICGRAAYAEHSALRQRLRCDADGSNGFLEGIERSRFNL